jgi:hypothetical protein
MVVNAAARSGADAKTGDVVIIILMPDTDNREIDIPSPLQRALGAKLT